MTVACRSIFENVLPMLSIVQLSVFQCRLSRRRRAELETRLRELVKNGEDHVLLIDVGPADKIELALWTTVRKRGKIALESKGL
jgi:CRISPR-associated protein Cas2